MRARSALTDDSFGISFKQPLTGMESPQPEFNFGFAAVWVSSLAVRILDTGGQSGASSDLLHNSNYVGGRFD